MYLTSKFMFAKNSVPRLILDTILGFEIQAHRAMLLLNDTSLQILQMISRYCLQIRYENIVRMQRLIIILINLKDSTNL